MVPMTSAGASTLGSTWKNRMPGEERPSMRAAAT